jgi:hypothetical protein
VVTVAARQGSFTPWWKQLSVEVYGAGKPAAGAAVSEINGANIVAVATGYDSEQHRIVALVPDDGQGLELQLTY